MAGPIKQLLSPKILSPLSPVPGKINCFLNFPSVSQKSLTVPKQLTFTSPNVSPTIKSDVKICFNNVKKKEVETKVILEINTPNKVEILENGLVDCNLNILGKGKFGTVVKGIRRGKSVAVKVIKLEENAFLKDSLALNLDHENVVKTHEIVNNINKIFSIVIMEYLEDFTPLQKVIYQNDTNINNRDIIKYSKDLIAGICYLHENKLLHLDIKPKNILVNSETRVCKICDFGNSYSLNDKKPYTFQGTVAYASPELLMGKEPTEKCDIYSFGILLWQLIHREMPFANINQYELIVYRVVKFKLRPNCTKTNALFDSLYTKCWSQEPQDRPEGKEILNYLMSLESL